MTKGPGAYEFEVNNCPGHVGLNGDLKRCFRCGEHIDSLRPPEDDDNFERETDNDNETTTDTPAGK